MNSNMKPAITMPICGLDEDNTSPYGSAKNLFFLILQSIVCPLSLPYS